MKFNVMRSAGLTILIMTFILAIEYILNGYIDGSLNILISVLICIGSLLYTSEKKHKKKERIK